MKAGVIFTIAASIVVSAALGYLIGQRQPSSNAPRESDTSPTEPALGGEEKNDRRVLYWHDPMVPGAKFDKPGKSPFMDMDLVPVYADEESSDAAVHVPANVTQSLGIRIGTVEKAELSSQLSAVGSVAFEETRLTLVQARVDGYVARLHVRAPLTQVKRGDSLADIVAPDWLAAEEEYLALLDAESQRGTAIRDAARRRLTVLGIPESVIRRIETDRRITPSTTLVAPIAGVVAELAVRDGSAFTPGSTLFRINGLESVWVDAQVPEAQVSMIPEDAVVQVYASAWPGEKFAGLIATRLSQVDPRSRTLGVRVVVQNPGAKLAPGMFVALRFSSEAAHRALVVPSEAVIVTGERSVVIVARDDGGFDVAPVTVGTEMDDRTVILDGLVEGQRIVLSGQFLIDSEASLRAAVTRLTSVEKTDRVEAPGKPKQSDPAEAHSEHGP
jgi:membrane fusion protein, copper/silver efflux system